MPRDRIVAGSPVLILSSNEAGTVVQVRETSKTCVVKLTHDGSLRKRVPLSDVEPQSLENGPGALKLGDRVEAQFQSGERYYPGKVSAVNEDGTYEIQYDDGDVEPRVAYKQIKEAVRPVAQAMFTRGQVVMARYKKGRQWYRGRVESVHPGLSTAYDIIYDDGDEEAQVAEKDLKEVPVDDSITNKSIEVLHLPVDLISIEILRTGQKVDVRLQADDTLVPGQIKFIHREEEACDVLYDSGSSEKYVSIDRIHFQAQPEMNPAVETIPKSPEKPLKAQEIDSVKMEASFSVSERVLAHRESRSEWEEGVITSINTEGLCSKRFVLGDVEQTDVSFASLRPLSSREDPSQATRTSPIQEYVLLLDQLAMTLYESTEMKTRPKSMYFQRKVPETDNENEALDATIARLFDAPLLTSFQDHFGSYKPSGDPPSLTKEKLFLAIQDRLKGDKAFQPDTVKELLTHWFSRQESLRLMEEFPFSIMLVSLGYVFDQVAKQPIQKLVMSTLGGVRFASTQEQTLQVDVWRERLGDRVYQLLLQRFLAHAIPNCNPSRVYVADVASILSSFSNNAKTHDISRRLHELGLADFHRIHLSELLCLYVDQFGARSPWKKTSETLVIELRPIAFLAAYLYLEQDECIFSHGELVRRLCVGRTPPQVDLILRFRDAFSSFLEAPSLEPQARNQPMVSTSQLARELSENPSLERDFIALQRRASSVSLVELYASCGFSIDAIASALTVSNAVERLKLQINDSSAVSGILATVRSLCLKILRFPDNFAYWRVRVASPGFQAKIGRFHGAECLLEAVGFALSTDERFYELKAARTYSEGVSKRVEKLSKTTLEGLRGRCSELDTQLATLDGVDSILAIFHRLKSARDSLLIEECAQILTHLLFYVESVLENLQDQARRRIRKNNALFRRQLGRVEDPFVDDLMAVIGYRVDHQREPAYVLWGPKTHRLGRDVEWFLWRRRQELQAVLNDDLVWLRETLELPSKPEKKPACVSVLKGHLSMYSELFHRLSDEDAISYETFERTIAKTTTLSIPSNFSRSWLSPLAFDVNRDGKIDLADFENAFALREAFKKNSQPAKDSTKLCLPDAIALLVGKLRITLTREDAFLMLLILHQVVLRILKDPRKPHLWWQLEATPNSNGDAELHHLLKVVEGRELMELLGYKLERNSTSRWRFARVRLGQNLAKEVTRVQSFASILQQHLRAIYFSDHVSDVNAVARGIVASGVPDKSYGRMLAILLRCIDNVLKDSTGQYRILHTASKAFALHIGNVKGARALFDYVGFRETSESQLVLPDEVTSSTLQKRRLEISVAHEKLQERMY
uniref:Uncharacterized protein AlNc14C94G5784 n=1 Tax=Albugo laibachii Nc14 TaxID=890382 RepID=F0WGQ7_9STRA|nr:conserved hypothetical protein [Albugo laibachii Nc14]|eukprot:CCA20421.1 conserved hypothetical protein [Albugo laibachii Nc14]